MSASREKKVRKDLAVNGIIDPKKIREAEERAKHRRTNILYGVIAGVFVLVAAFLLLWNTHVIQRGLTAVNVDGTKYSAAEVEYFYHYNFNNLLNSSYANYMGISPNMNFGSKMSDMAQYFLGVQDADMTWDSYLKGRAVEDLKYITALTREAEKNNFTLPEDAKKEIDEELAGLGASAKEVGMSESAYIKALYGSNMTKETLTKMVNQSALAREFNAHQRDSRSYTADDLEKYYQDHKDDLDVVTYEAIFFSGTPETKKDDDGNQIAATDEEKAAAKKAAADNAAAALERFKAGEDLKALAEEYENATYSNNEKIFNENLSYSLPVVANWLFDAERADGDVTTLDSDPNCYLLLFHSRSRTDDRTIDVRHILFATDTSDLDKNSETYEDDLQKRKDEAKAKADEALSKWKNGEATGESFAALANELSEDPGSNTNGGLYEKVSPGDMVASFNDWCFDDSRKSGDTGVVETDYGYHVMYFVGDNVPHWQKISEQSLRNDDHDAWLESLVKEYTITRGSGMKYVD